MVYLGVLRHKINNVIYHAQVAIKDAIFHLYFLSVLGLKCACRYDILYFTTLLD